MHKRVSIENIVSSGWALGAMALARQPTALPVARVLDWQAPVAGVIVEDVAKGTLLDRVLQPLARGGEKAEKAMALAGPPLLVGIITANPSWAPALRPLLKMSMMSWFQLASPAMDKVQKRAAKFNEESPGRPGRHDRQSVGRGAGGRAAVPGRGGSDQAGPRRMSAIQWAKTVRCDWPGCTRQVRWS